MVIRTSRVFHHMFSGICWSLTEAGEELVKRFSIISCRPFSCCWSFSFIGFPISMSRKVNDSKHGRQTFAGWLAGWLFLEFVKIVAFFFVKWFLCFWSLEDPENNWRYVFLKKRNSPCQASATTRGGNLGIIPWINEQKRPITNR